MRKLCICVLILCCLMAFAACSKKDSAKEGTTVLATIDGESITLEEFNRELDRIPMNMKMLVAGQDGKKTYLDRLIVKRLILKEAKKEKVEGEKEFQDRLAEIKDQLLIESILKKKVVTNVQIADDELTKYYESHKEQFKRPREINTRHIVVKTEEEARQIQAKLQKGEDFAELARNYSIEPNAKATGGEIGFQPQGSLVPEFEQAAFKLKKTGDVSPIVKTQFGYHIIRLEGLRPPAYAPFDEVKDYIRQNLVQAKQGETIEKYVEELKKSAKITKNEDLLKGEEKPAEKGAPSEKPAAKTTPADKQEKPAPKPEPSPKK
jgi:peptidyl-prolyl cis-trans isomerase C